MPLEYSTGLLAQCTDFEAPKPKYLESHLDSVRADFSLSATWFSVAFVEILHSLVGDCQWYERFPLRPWCSDCRAALAWRFTFVDRLRFLNIYYLKYLVEFVRLIHTFDVQTP